MSCKIGNCQSIQNYLTVYNQIRLHLKDRVQNINYNDKLGDRLRTILDSDTVKSYFYHLYHDSGHVMELDKDELIS
jgi:hypothetical protein